MMVPATSGKETLANATCVFKAGVDKSLTRLQTNVSERHTPATPAVAYEFRKDADATFPEVFSSLRRVSPLVWQQSQIVTFCRNFSDYLQPDMYGTSFLFSVGEKLFVAEVFRKAMRTEARRELFVQTHRLDENQKVSYTYQQPRVIVPQV